MFYNFITKYTGIFLEKMREAFALHWSFTRPYIFFVLVNFVIVILSVHVAEPCMVLA